jgi:hypothetical protein
MVFCTFSEIVRSLPLAAKSQAQFDNYFLVSIFFNVNYLGGEVYLGAGGSEIWLWQQQRLQSVEKKESGGSKTLFTP